MSINLFINSLSSSSSSSVSSEDDIPTVTSAEIIEQNREDKKNMFEGIIKAGEVAEDDLIGQGTYGYVFKKGPTAMKFVAHLKYEKSGISALKEAFINYHLNFSDDKKEYVSKILDFNCTAFGFNFSYEFHPIDLRKYVNIKFRYSIDSFDGAEIKLMNDIKNAVEYLHLAKKVIHGDLHMCNVILKSDTVPYPDENSSDFEKEFINFIKNCDAKLIDLGLSSFKEKIDEHYVPHSPPELYTPDPELYGVGIETQRIHSTAEKIDYFSAGCVMYYIANGHGPFEEIINGNFYSYDKRCALLNICKAVNKKCGADIPVKKAADFGPKYLIKALIPYTVEFIEATLNRNIKCRPSAVDLISSCLNFDFNKRLPLKKSKDIHLFDINNFKLSTSFENRFKRTVAALEEYGVEEDDMKLVNGIFKYAEYILNKLESFKIDISRNDLLTVSFIFAGIIHASDLNREDFLKMYDLQMDIERNKSSAAYVLKLLINKEFRLF